MLSRSCAKWSSSQTYRDLHRWWRTLLNDHLLTTLQKLWLHSIHRLYRLLMIVNWLSRTWRNIKWSWLSSSSDILWNTLSRLYKTLQKTKHCLRYRIYSALFCWQCGIQTSLNRTTQYFSVISRTRKEIKVCNYHLQVRLLWVVAVASFETWFVLVSSVGYSVPDRRLHEPP